MAPAAPVNSDASSPVRSMVSLAVAVEKLQKGKSGSVLNERS